MRGTSTPRGSGCGWPARSRCSAPSRRMPAFIRDETLARELDVGGRAARPDLEQQVDLDGVAAVIGVQRHGAE